MFTGSLVALVTPMHIDGSIDWQALEALINWHIASQTQAIVVAGTTGEAATLTLDEHKAVMRFCVDIANDRIPIIAGAGANATARAIELTLAAYHCGCAASLQVTPYYNRPPQRGLYAHFAKIAAAAPLPMILYNVPTRTACDIALETVAALAKIAHIIGIKEATPHARLVQIRQLFPKNQSLKIYGGEDALCAQAACEGLIDGVISVTANVAPEAMQNMMHCALNGDLKQAQAINQRLAALHESLFCETNPIAVKWALQRMGKIAAGIRLPLMPLDERWHESLTAALVAAGITIQTH